MNKCEKGAIQLQDRLCYAHINVNKLLKCEIFFK